MSRFSYNSTTQQLTPIAGNMNYGMVAPVEESPAKATHVVGDFILVNGILYIVTTAIAIGDSIVVAPATGYNVEIAGSIVDQIKDKVGKTDYATTSQAGVVKVDGITITIDNNGVISGFGGSVIAPTEVSPSTAAYSIGDSLIYNGILYNVIAAIAINDTLTEGINISPADMIQDQINSMSSALTNKVNVSDIVNNLTEITTGKVLDATQGLALANKHKVTQFTVDTSSWTSDATSQSGTTLYKKSIALNHVYVDSPSVDIGSTGVLPTNSEQESYRLLKYVTVDSTIPCLYLYSGDIPETTFYINVTGVD